MAITVEIDVAGWTDITAYIPFHGDQEQGIIPFELEKVKESNVAILRFGMDSSAVNPPPGTEIRVRDGALTHFGGYITSREQSRHGAATTMLTSNYACQDYNSIMDRIVVPSYTIDAGDTDSTEIETLRATYLAGIGVTAGTISTIDASMEEIELSGTFRQCMEAICGVVGGATFYIAPTKVLNYGAQAWSVTGTENLSDDLSVADSHPYTNFVARDDESRRINAVYIIGEGIEGWYPDPPGANYYQAIISDPSITTQTALDNLGAAITGDFGTPLEEQFLTQWNTDVWEYDEVTVRHSDLIVGAPSLWTRRSMMRARTVDGTELVIDMEFGDHTVESDYLGPSPGTGGGGGMVDHILLSSPYHSDTTEATVSRGAMIIGDSTPLWGALAHPAAAGYALTTTATDTGWDQTPDWTGLHTFGAGWVLSGGTADLNGLDLILDADGDTYLHEAADDVIGLVLAGASGEFTIWINGAEDFDFTANLFTCQTGSNIDLNGNDLLLDADGDSYLHASADDVVDIVLPGASGELGIWINGAEDFTFTANAFNVPTGSNIYLSQFIYHLGDTDTFLSFADDRAQLTCGGAIMWVGVEGAADYVQFPNDIYAAEYIRHDADTNTYIRFEDDEITIAVGGIDLINFVELGLVYVDFPQGDVYINRTSSNAFNNLGLTIDQDSEGGEIISLWSSDVGHGITAQTNTRCYGHFAKFEDTSGGLMMTGIKDADGANHSALRFRGFLGEAPQTTKSAASYGVTSFGTWEKSGIDVVEITTANANLFSWDTAGATRMILDADGDLHLDATSNESVWDAWDDCQLVRALDLERAPDQVIRSEFDDYVQYNRDDLERAGIVTFNEDGHHFVNVTQLQRLHNGAIWQLYQRCQMYERALTALGALPEGEL
jgi:hypothetical protein